MNISDIPRVPISFLPTPLEPLRALTEHLGGPRIWIKRDDMTGLATGGNKARKLEFLFADAIEKRADTVFTAAGIQSNCCRMTAAAARKFGLKCVLGLSGEKPGHLTGNLLLDEIMGCEYVFLPDFRGKPDLEDIMATVFNAMQGLREEGRNVYWIPPGGSVPLGNLGYYLAAHEMFEQAQERGFRIDHILLANGSGGTQAGLLAGVKCLDMPASVIGISVSKKGSMKEIGPPSVDAAANLVGELIGKEVGANAEDVIIHYDYYGEDYGKVTDECIDAIKLVARLEGIILDPVYTGKAMAGLIDLVKKGSFRNDENIVFLHTGGYPGLFPYGDSFRERI
jgi:D-cysteine desulfhydrase family pyridoxal phosphate-dependent enzyme